MMIHDVTKLAGKHKKRKRIGRGIGSGTGKTAGRGTKGSGSRSGWSGSIRASREGGQTPFFTRIGKRGFNNHNFRVEYYAINLSDLNAAFNEGESVTPEAMVERKLLKNLSLPIKVLGLGSITKKLSVTAHGFSKSAIEKIQAAGGTAQTRE
jgi:large subunit ribosomal protein L15